MTDTPLAWGETSGVTIAANSTAMQLVTFSQDVTVDSLYAYFGGSGSAAPRIYNASGGTLLASGASVSQASPMWAYLPLSASVALSAGVTYQLVLYVASGSSETVGQYSNAPLSVTAAGVTMTNVTYQNSGTITVWRATGDNGGGSPHYDGILYSMGIGIVPSGPSSFTATAAQTLPAITQTATGTRTIPPRTATAAQTLPSLTQAATGAAPQPAYWSQPVTVTISSTPTVPWLGEGTFPWLGVGTVPYVGT